MADPDPMPTCSTTNGYHLYAADASNDGNCEWCGQPQSPTHFV